MNVGSMGIVGGAAGSSLSQRAGSEVERTKQDAATKDRQVQGDKKAEDAAGIGKTEQDEGTSERDADGRRIWEHPPEGNSAADQDEAEQSSRRAKDPSGQSGGKLDLMG